MLSFKTIGEEIKSSPQLLAFLIVSPLIIQYVIWAYLPKLNGITVNSEITAMIPDMDLQYLNNVTSRMDLFESAVSSQISSLFVAVSRIHQAVFLLGGLLAAFLIAEPIYRGTIINDIAFLGRDKALSGRLIFGFLYSIFLISTAVVVFSGVAEVSGISLESRFFLVLFGTLILSTLAGFVLVSLLSVLSRESIIPLGMLFLAVILSGTAHQIGSVILPFERLTYFLWDTKFHLDRYVYAGLLMYGTTPFILMCLFKGGDFY
ncbi:hypothetical protein [Thermococcus waiotapuensis]|uniref:Uncharacterized protein n=1 Tax=Thermococcus waiotapuensis TaxID=90909 RepID=A0AAE4NUQ7_9EURY|nr:hypothetical protein [Thermococcus waiotapuensis]MDV3103188.1 hypothetical protein [Thermococcus waiotapuensis]